MSSRKPANDHLDARSTLVLGDDSKVNYYRLDALQEAFGVDIVQLPFTLRILLENLLRHSGSAFAQDGQLEKLAAWKPGAPAGDFEFPFMPGRVLLQDFTGVPSVVDLAAMRSAVGRAGRDVSAINPQVPVDLVIDHSVQIDSFGTKLAFARNVDLEYQRNAERYALLRWAQQSFKNFRVVPPGTGIVHQVNLEYLAPVVATRKHSTGTVAFPDTLVGTDSHTTMINGLGVLGWGVGGIEAEGVMLGQPVFELMPEVIGFRMTGALPPGSTATDLVLRVTEILRGFGVVGRFVEFFGKGLGGLGLADRATISNMAPEYGATAALFPVDDVTLRYLKITGRSAETVDLVERYCKEQHLFRTETTTDPQFTDVIELDLSTVVPSMAGPRRPQDRVELPDVQTVFRGSFPDSFTSMNGDPHAGSVAIQIDNSTETLHHGSVAIAAITSCTNTSNPNVMLAAGLLARRAVQRGLNVPSHVKTSMAPGSHVVSAMLDKAGLTPYLEALGFHTVGYGCTTCIGNSGPLPEPVAEAVDANQLVVTAVLSGNRNFEGRIHPQVRASFLASPPLVVAYALAGTVDIDLTTQPLGTDPNNDPVYLTDLWPTSDEVQLNVTASLDADTFRHEYSSVFTGDAQWQNLPVPTGEQYLWDPTSTYVQEPPNFINMPIEPVAPVDISGARVLVMLGDSITTDHISPAGSIQRTSPAGEYLIDHQVAPIDFNSYGSRRGNHEVMIRGTFANVRLHNQLTPGKEGNHTRYLPTNHETTIYDASCRYQKDGTPLIVLGGKEYGSGSSRDWAAKGTLLLGVKAVLVESFEHIHRSNLVGMGVLPLEYLPGEHAAVHGLSGEETYSITGISEGLTPRKQLTVTAVAEDGATKSFGVIARIDSPVEIEYFRQGGILSMILRDLTD